MKQIKKIIQTKKFLFDLGDLVVKGITITLEARRYQKIYLSGGGHDEVLILKRASQQKLWLKNLQQLRRSNYIKIKKEANKMIICLTNKGQTALLKNQIKNSPPSRPGYSTLIFFDIPEQAATARKQLRQFLQTTNFKQIQKSVWFHKSDVVIPLKKFLDEYNFTNWVKVAYAQLK